MDDDKLTVLNILKNVGFHSIKHKKGLKSARMKMLCIVYQKQ